MSFLPPASTTTAYLQSSSQPSTPMSGPPKSARLKTMLNAFDQTAQSNARGNPGQRPHSAGIMKHSGSVPNLHAHSTFITTSSASADSGEERTQKVWAEPVMPPGEKVSQGRIRPSTAMARMPGKGMNSEEQEFEQMKIDIVGILKKLSPSARQWSEMEGLLRRYSFSTEGMHCLI